jgi:hypothetical protein
LISCGHPDCPAPLHEELAAKKQPAGLLYLPESHTRH